MFGAFRRGVSSNLVDSISGLTAYYRADLLVTDAGAGAVSAWGDSSGSGDSNKNAVQGTAGARPTLITADAAFNNQSMISWDGGDRLVTPAWAASLAQPLTMYWVGLSTSGGNGYIVDGIGISNRAGFYDAAGGIATVVPNFNASTASLASKCIICCVFNGASSAIYRNDSTTANLSGNFGAHTLTGLTIGARYDGGLNGIMKAGELRIYSGAHNQATRSIVFAYAGARYGGSWS